MLSKILIVDDNAIIAERTRILIDEFPNFKVEDMVFNYQDAQKLIQSNHYDLILLDINLNEEKSGIDLAKQIDKLKVPFIFITSYSDSQTIIGASAFKPVNYLVKPIKKQDLFVCLEMFYHQQLTHGYIAFKDGKKEHQIKVSHIVFIKSEGNYCAINLSNTKIIVRAKISIWSELHQDLKRVHKSYVVNQNHIKSKKTKELILFNNQRIPFSDKYFA